MISTFRLCILRTPLNNSLCKIILVFSVFFGVFSACSPLLVPHPISRITQRIARTNIVGIYRDPQRYCAPTAPPNFPAPQKIVVTDSALLDDLCVLGFKNRVIASTAPLPAYLQAVYPHILYISPKNTPTNADIILRSATDTTLSNTHLPIMTIAGNNWKERLYHLAQYLHVEKTAIIALKDYSQYSAQTSTLLDTKNTEVSLITINPPHIFLLGRTGFAAQVLSDANVGRPDRIDFDKSRIISPRDLSLADADLIYISYPPTAISATKHLLNSSLWSQLGAASQNRQFIVNYSWWNQGKGLMAARSILDDLRDSLNYTS